MPFKVNITLDARAFDASLIDINKNVRKAADEASGAAAEYLAEEIRVLLSIWVHPKSEPSPTKPFKGPPGLISGHLRDTVEVQEMAIKGFHKVAVTAAYSRIQELGGFAGLHHTTYIPPRPYFRPTVMDMRSLVGIEHIFYQEWRAAMLAAIPEGMLIR